MCTDTIESRTYGQKTYPTPKEKRRTQPTSSRKQSNHRHRKKRTRVQSQPITCTQTPTQKTKAEAQKTIRRIIGSSQYQKASRTRYHRSIAQARNKRRATRAAIEGHDHTTAQSIRTAIITTILAAAITTFDIQSLTNQLSLPDLVARNDRQNSLQETANTIESPIVTDAVQNDSRNNRRNSNLFQATRTDIRDHI